MPPQKPRRLGEILLERGWVTHEQLFRALEKQQQVGGRLGTALVEIDALSEDLLLQALTEQLRIPSVGIDELRSVPPEVLDLVPARIAVRCRAIPFRLAGSQVHVAMTEVKNLAFQDELAFVTAKRIKVYVCSEARIFEALEKFYDHQCPSRYAQLVDRLNRARYLWDRGVEVPVPVGIVENAPIFQSAERALGPTSPPAPEPKIPAPASVSLPAPAPVAAAAVAAAAPVVVAVAPAAPAPKEAPAEPLPATPLPSAPAAPEPTRPAAPKPAAAPGFETRVTAPGSAPLAPTSFAPAPDAQPLSAARPPGEITLVVNPAAPQVEPAPARLAPVAPPAPRPMAAPVPPVKTAAAAPAISAGELETRLLSPRDRDDVGRTLLAYLSERFTRVALFVVRKNEVAGWMGEGTGLDQDALTKYQADLAKPSVFLNLMQGGEYVLGPLTPMPAHRDLARCWGGEMPAECLLLPIRLKGRLVSFLYADRGAEGLRGLDLDDMLHLAAKVSIAFELCIMRNKLRNA